MIGDWDDGSCAYGPFFASGCMPQCPQVVVKAVEADVGQHMSAQGLGSPLIESPTVAGTLAAITMCQGALIEGDGAAAFGAASGAIVTMVGECKGKDKGVGEGEDKLLSRGGEDDSLVLIQSLQAEVAAVNDVNHQLGNTIEDIQDANEVLKGDNARLQGALSSAEEKAFAFEEKVGALELRAKALEGWVAWLIDVKVARARAGKYALALCDRGVADVAALRALGCPRAGELLANVGMNKIETQLVLKHLN